MQGLEVRTIAPRLCLRSHPYMAFVENWRRMEISNFTICLYLLQLVWVCCTSVESGEQFSGIICPFPHGSSQHGTQATGLGRLQVALPTEPFIPLPDKALAFVDFVKCKDDITLDYCRDWVHGVFLGCLLFHTLKLSAQCLLQLEIERYEKVLNFL